MLNRRWGLSFVLVFLFFSIATFAQEAKQSFGVVGRYPLDGEALADELVLYFSQPLAPWTSKEPPVTVTPALAGTIDVGENYIALHPNPESLRRKSRYTVVVSPDLRSEAGYSLADPERAFVFPTYEVRLEKVSVREQTEDGVLLEFLLTDEVPIDSLRTGGVTVTNRSGVSVPIWIEALPLRHAYGLKLPAGTDFPVTIALNKGVPDRRGVFQTGHKYWVQFPHPKPLEVASSEWKRMPDSREVLTINFSAPVDSEQLKRVVGWNKLPDDTPIKFAVKPKGSYRTLTLESTQDLSKVEKTAVTIGRRLSSSDLRELAEPYRASVTRSLDQLRITSHYWEDGGVNGPVLHVTFNGTLALDALKGHVRVVPDIGALTFEPGYYRQMIVRGAWKSETSYTLAFDAGIEDAAGTIRLGAPLNYVLGKTPKSHGVEFAYPDKYYFPQQHQGKLVLRSLNEDSATLTVHRLFPSNVAAAVNMLRGNNTNVAFDRQYAESLGEIEVKLPDTRDAAVETTVNLENVLGKDRRGVFTAELRPYRDSDNTKILVWTDIGAMAHWQQDEFAVYVHNLYTLVPIAAAKVTVYSSKNQVMGAAATDNRGIVRLRGLDPKLGSPRAALIETESDYAFLELQNAETGDLPTAGLGPYDRDAYDVFMYSDRNLYRPGEPVHLDWIVRTNYGEALANVPLQFRLWNPNHQEVRTDAVTLSEFGTGGIDIPTKGTDPTGQYLAEVRVPGEQVALQSYRFHLEEFVPNRIKTTVELASNVWRADEAQSFSVKAENLFGGPARSRKSEATLILRKGTFTTEAWPGFFFGNDTPFEPVVRSLGEAETGDDGRAEFTFDGQAPDNASFPVNVTVRGEVRELGGRAVVNSARATLFPSDVALGVAASSNAAGDAVVAHVAAMQPDETPANLDTVTVTLERRTWHYFIRRYRGYNEPSWTESYEPISEETVPLTDGRGQVEMPVPGYGYYRVRVHSDATPQFSTRNFYRFWDRIQTMDAGAKDLVTLTTDAAGYAPGQTASLRIESPFGGKAVVCVQGESIYDFFTVDLVDNKAEVQIPIESAYRPNVWAEVTVIHNVDGTGGETHPFSSFAMVNLRVQSPQHKLDVSFPDLPEEVRPARTVPITIQTSDDSGHPVPATITVAAVDEGIHTILGYTTPDPFGWFDRSRAPALNRAEYYDQVAYDFEPPGIGGGAIQKRLGKEPSVGENWIHPVALWSGTVMTDANGRATVKFKVPEFNGQLRIVAVAANATATGAQSEPLYVRRPYMLRTSLPRFVLPGDTFRGSAVVFNTTQSPVTAQIGWTSAGSLRGGSGQKTVRIDAGGEKQVYADFAASPTVGQGRIDWKMDVLDPAGNALDTLDEQAALPTRQPSVFQSERKFVVLQPGETLALTNTKFLENELLESRVVVAANPALRLQGALKDLIGYPYGCVEQTVSRCMPLYLLNKSKLIMASTLDRNAEVSQYVQAGIDRIFSMQTPSGGIAFWPGGNDPYPYGSVYAAHFLSLVRKDAAFDVPDAQWKALRDYARRVAFADDDGSAAGRYLRAYAMYVLALDGDTEAMDQVSRFDAVKMPKSARHLLAAAIAMNTADPQRARDYLADAPTMAYEGRETSGNLNSEIRGTSVELLALVAMEAPQAELAPHAEVLMRFLDNAKYPNTQDIAFAATALGRYIETLESDFSAARCTITSPDGQTTIAGTKPYRDNREGSAARYTVANDGAAPVFVDFVTAGIPARLDLNPVSQGMTIDRVVRAGHTRQPMSNRFDRGDSYVVTLRLETKQHLENVVVADLLPAGFEIENPRLDSDTLIAMNLQDNSMQPSHLEVRDDRLVAAFDTLAPGKYRFHYVVRAVTPGTFTWPSVEAECMYDPAVRARNVPSTITIESAQ